MALFKNKGIKTERFPYLSATGIRERIVKIETGIIVSEKDVEFTSVTGKEKKFMNDHITDFKKGQITETKFRQAYEHWVDENTDGLKIHTYGPIEDAFPEAQRLVGSSVKVRITPKEKYERICLIESLIKKKKLLAFIPSADFRPNEIPSEDPFYKLERAGRIHRLGKAGRKHIHYIHTRYENPKESRTKEYKMEEYKD
jgi:hypothetical protein